MRQCVRFEEVALLSFDTTLIGPTRPELERAVRGAVEAANQRCRTRLLPWPPAGYADFLTLAQNRPEGYRQFTSGAEDNRAGVHRSAVAVAWWTDRAGRRHYRVVGRREQLTIPQLRHLLSPKDPLVPPLVLVHPAAVVARAEGDRRSWAVQCPLCSAAGAPEALGWMGECCGPCHDRREAGEAAATPGRPAVYFAGHKSAVSRLVFSPDSTVLVSAGYDRTARVWDVRAGQALGGLTRRCEGLCGVVAGPPVRVATYWYGAVTFWDLPAGTKGEQRGVEGCDSPYLSPDGTRLALCGDPAPIVYDIQTGERTVFEEAGQEVWACTFAPDGATLASVVEDGHGVALWDVTTGRLQETIRLTGCPITCAIFTPDGKALALACPTPHGTGHRVELWDVAERTCRSCCLVPDSYRQSPLAALCFSPDGSALFAAVGAAVQAWDAAIGRHRGTIAWDDTRLTALTVSPDGSLLAVGNQDGAIRVWPSAGLAAV
jgi:WD40 repeat protein